MEQGLNILKVMSASNVEATLTEALANKKAVLGFKSISDPFEDVDHCLLLEWLVNTDKADGFNGVFIESMEIAFTCQLLSKGKHPKIAIKEVLTADFYCPPDQTPAITPVLIPDSTYFPFSTESLKPILNRMLPKLVVKINGHQAEFSFDNNPRLLDEKTRLDKETLKAVNEMLLVTYNPLLSDDENMANLKKDLYDHQGITIPDNYYIEEQLDSIVTTHGFNLQHHAQDA